MGTAFFIVEFCLLHVKFHVNNLFVLDAYFTAIDPNKDNVFQIHNVLVKLAVFVMSLFTRVLRVFVIFDSKGLVNATAVLLLTKIVKFSILIHYFYSLTYLTVRSTVVIIFLFFYRFNLTPFYALD